MDKLAGLSCLDLQHFPYFCLVFYHITEDTEVFYFVSVSSSGTIYIGSFHCGTRHRKR